ncbi:MAG: TonB-dependent receptor plug domain-containing protein [Sphingomonas sp.]|uniref:TonB-dependent receptor n=1 Tax=Sphingomonas sp. TaxID=28214 RepID=UPI001AC5EDE8|nr:TonB-dependent receptor plug domain-containing protein [Sphingomonas sp.]MBN8809354.1 TonB-dependent receptor plug domain-containing protein [Sphingomonas sp.]
MTLLAGSAIAALTCANPSVAQDAQTKTPDREKADGTKRADAATLTDGSKKQDDANSPDIVITGTRLQDPSFSAPSPLQVITSEQGKERGLISVTELVQETPAAGGQQQKETSSNGFPSNGGGGSTTIDLRGMGSARTLVLINGHRVGPAGTGAQISQIDLTLIPYAMVSRVETLTNGASTIYGSDAVAGVVNIITKDDDEGGKLSLYGMMPQHGGGNYYNISARYGLKFARGSLSFGFGYTKANVLYASQRKDTTCDEDYVFNADGSRADIRNPDGTPKCWGYGYLYKYAGGGSGSTVGYLNGYLRPSNATVGTGYLADLNGYTRIYQSTQAPADKYNGFYPYYSGGLNNGSQAMVSPSERYSLFASGSYQLTPSVELYGEALGTRRNSEQIYLTYFQTPYISPQNPNSPFN